MKTVADELFREDAYAKRYSTQFSNREDESKSPYLDNNTES
jgi:hypothetical protein